VFRLPRTFCHACAPYLPSRSESRPLVYGGGAIVLGTCALATATADPVPLLIFGGVFSAFLLGIIIHELGHAAAARLAGISVLDISIGSGSLCWVVRLGTLPVYFRTYPFVGAITRTFYDGVEPSRSRSALLLGGGAGVNLLLGIGALAAAQGLANADSYAALVGFGIGAPQIWIGLYALVPRNWSFAGRRVASDGSRLIALLRAPPSKEDALKGRAFALGQRLIVDRRFHEAVEHFRAAHERFPENGSLFALLVHAAGEAAGNRAAVDCYLGDACSADPFKQPDKAGFAWALANVAWSAARLDEPELTDLADRLSQHALGILPSAAGVLAARAVALGRLGQAQEAAALLTEAARLTRFISDKWMSWRSSRPPSVAAGIVTWRTNWPRWTRTCI
jgi:hypothetical protein